MEQKNAYYAYYDDDNQLYYYFNVITNDSRWDYPLDGKVIDPESMKSFPNPYSLFPKIKKSKRSKKHGHSSQKSAETEIVSGESQNADDELLVLDIDEKLENLEDFEKDSLLKPKQSSPSSKSAKPPKIPNKKKVFVPPTSDGPHYLPKEISSEIHKFQGYDFAKRHFQRCVNGRVFKRTSITLENIVLFSEKPITTSLLSNLPQSSVKNALKCFNLILQYTGVSSSHQGINAAKELISILFADASLRDEVFFQLMKQTRQNPDEKWLLNTWNLFLVIASIFPSTRNSENWIKSYLLRNIESDNRKVATIAQFTYIKFGARCAIGTPMENFANNVKSIIDLQNQMTNGSFVFGVSLYEMMWGQRRTLPNCPVPFFFHQMCESLISKGALKIEGIFRMPGNMKNVNDWAAESNAGEEVLSSITNPHDLASFIKLWIRELADPIVPFSATSELFTAFKEDRTIEYITTVLPKLHLMTLAYLIGFLQRVVAESDANKMTPRNLAICFGPNVIRTNNETVVTKNSMEAVNDILCYLIKEWDVSSIYPLRDELLLPV